MKFLIQRDALQKELAIVQGIVERKATIPMLSNILLETVGKKGLAISGTDLDVNLRCQVEAQVTEPGALCLSAQKLFEIARLLPDGDVSFASDEPAESAKPKSKPKAKSKKEQPDLKLVPDEQPQPPVDDAETLAALADNPANPAWVTIVCEDAKFRILSAFKSAFPEMPQFKKTNVTLSSQILRAFIQRTISAITKEESRYTLSGAKFIIDKGLARMVTTDGHRLALMESAGAVEDTEAALDTLIPRKALAELVKLTAAYDGEVGIAADEARLYFELGDRLLSTRMLVGQFPQWEMILPQNNDKTVTVDVAGFSLAVKRANLMADDRTHAIKLVVGGERLTVSAQADDAGEAEASLQVVYKNGSGEPDPITIGFNALYLQDFFSAAPVGQIEMCLKDGNSQALFTLGDREDGGMLWRTIIMPVRLG